MKEISILKLEVIHFNKNSLKVRVNGDETYLVTRRVFNELADSKKESHAFVIERQSPCGTGRTLWLATPSIF